MMLCLNDPIRPVFPVDLDGAVHTVDWIIDWMDPQRKN
jgi:hypothetical protein